MRIENTFGIEAEAREVITYDSEESLTAAIQRLHTLSESLPVLLIGCGSNLLFLSDYDGIVLKSSIKGVCLLQETEQ